jgi:hypothetical protein
MWSGMMQTAIVLKGRAFLDGAIGRSQTIDFFDQQIA